jgi:hypothetical protein
MVYLKRSQSGIRLEFNKPPSLCPAQDDERKRLTHARSARVVQRASSTEYETSTQAENGNVMCGMVRVVRGNMLKALNKAFTQTKSSTSKRDSCFRRS